MSSNATSSHDFADDSKRFFERLPHTLHNMCRRLKCRFSQWADSMSFNKGEGEGCSG